MYTVTNMYTFWPVFRIKEETDVARRQLNSTLQRSMTQKCMKKFHNKNLTETLEYIIEHPNNRLQESMSVP
jgi:hypothetical protein